MVCLLVSSTDKWRIVFLQAPDFKLWHFHKVTQLPIYRAVKKKKKKAWHHNFCGTINTTASTWVFRAEPLLNRAAVIDCRPGNFRITCSDSFLRRLIVPNVLHVFLRLRVNYDWLRETLSGVASFIFFGAQYQQFFFPSSFDLRESKFFKGF